jgi:hypothetical protein
MNSSSSCLAMVSKFRLDISCWDGFCAMSRAPTARFAFSATAFVASTTSWHAAAYARAWLTTDSMSESVFISAIITSSSSCGGRGADAWRRLTMNLVLRLSAYSALQLQLGTSGQRRAPPLLAAPSSRWSQMLQRPATPGL